MYLLPPWPLCPHMTIHVFAASLATLSSQDIDWVQTEKHVFEQASNHPFLVGLHSCFQTESRYCTVCVKSPLTGLLHAVHVLLCVVLSFNL